MMTVAGLIEELSKHDPAAPVVIPGVVGVHYATGVDRMRVLDVSGMLLDADTHDGKPVVVVASIR